MQHSSTLAETEDYLKQRSSFCTCLAPHSLNACAESRVDLHTMLVDSFRSGCMTYTGAKKALDKGCCCGFDRYTANGRAFKTATHWLFASWLQAVLADPIIGPGMLRSMERARNAAAVAVNGVHDWYDGQTFCAAVSAGYFSSKTTVALSISTEGFET